MPRNPFPAWSPSSSPEGLPSVFAPLFEDGARPSAWKFVDHTPVVSSTSSLVEVRLPDGSHCVLKHLAPNDRAGGRWQASSDPRHPLYWRREALFFASETSKCATESFRPVRCLGQVAVGGGVSLQLERVEGRQGSTWTESDYERAAHALGQWQRELCAYPEEPWVCRDWLEGYVGLRIDHDALIRDQRKWREFAGFSASEQELVQQLLDERAAQFRVLASCAKLPAHNDFWPPNLFMVNETLVVLDWSFPGMGPLGSDLCTLAFDAIYDGFLRLSDAMEFVGRLRRAYAEGAQIQASGELELAIMTGLVTKYLWFFGYFLARGKEVAASEFDSRMEAMRLILAAGSWLRCRART